MSRNHVMTVVLLTALLGVAPAAAQDAETPAETTPAEAPAESAESAGSAAETGAPAEGEGAQAPAEGEAAEAPNEAVTEVQATAPAPQPEVRRYARPRTPPPVMVVVLPGERIEDEVVTAAREAIVAQITPLAGSRAVHGLGVPQMVAALAACDDDPCIGGQLASAGAAAGIVLRIERRGPRQLTATLEIRDPVSGTARQEVVEGRVPRDAAEIGAALAELTARIGESLPSEPPPNPTLLVTTTHDGALVTIDGEDIGESPVAPLEIADGTHEILVRLAGYNTYRTETQISPGENARVDATLASTVPGEGGGGDNPFTQADEGEEDLLSTWWFWTIVGGGAALVIAGVAIGLAVGLSDQPPPVPPVPMGIPLPPITGGM